MIVLCIHTMSLISLCIKTLKDRFPDRPWWDEKETIPLDIIEQLCTEERYWDNGKIVVRDLLQSPPRRNSFGVA